MIQKGAAPITGAAFLLLRCFPYKPQNTNYNQEYNKCTTAPDFASAIAVFIVVTTRGVTTGCCHFESIKIV